MINALRNPGMRDRHYQMLSLKLGIKIQPTPNFTVRAAIKLDLPRHIKMLDEVIFPLLSSLVETVLFLLWMSSAIRSFRLLQDHIRCPVNQVFEAASYFSSKNTHDEITLRWILKLFFSPALWPFLIHEDGSNW